MNISRIINVLCVSLNMKCVFGVNKELVVSRLLLTHLVLHFWELEVDRALSLYCAWC